MTEGVAEAKPPAVVPPACPQSDDRLLSLDACRGFIMLALASAGLGIPKVARSVGGAWARVAAQLDHVPWEGCAAWDLVQPAFMFMVGVAAAWSYARRQARGDSWARMFAHALKRSAVLVLMGVFLASAWSKRTNWVFTNVLAQIGLGYVFVFLLRGRSMAVQAAATAAILVAVWLAFYVYPAPQPGPDFDYAAYGLPRDWPLLSGIAAHWNKHTNLAARVDLWLLNLFPRAEPYALTPGGGGYHTLNFVSSTATMLLGLMAGQWLRSGRCRRVKFLGLVTAGGVLMAAGLAAGWTICPIVKRIWTPSWVLYSGAWVVWILAFFYGVVEVVGLRRWAFPLAVAGMNSIVIYMMSQLMKDWTWKMICVHLGPLVGWGPVDGVLRRVFGPEGFSPAYVPIVQSVAVVFVFWLVCVWLYRRRIFVRV